VPVLKRIRSERWLANVLHRFQDNPIDILISLCQ
jgi:hypothetical protein